MDNDATRTIFRSSRRAARFEYRDKLVGKFLNVLMGGGKKSTAERICYGAFDLIQEKTTAVIR